MVRTTSAVHAKASFALVESKCDRDELALIPTVNVTAGYQHTRLADLHLGPGTLGHGIDTEEAIATRLGEHREKVEHKVSRRTEWISRTGSKVRVSTGG